MVADHRRFSTFTGIVADPVKYFHHRVIVLLACPGISSQTVLLIRSDRQVPAPANPSSACLPTSIQGSMMSSQFPYTRPRRLRNSESMRSLFQETEFKLGDLVLPIFVEEEIDDFVPINSMPGVRRIPESKLASEIERYALAGIRSVMTFGVSHHLDDTGSDTWNENGLVARMARICKDAVPEMVVMSDTCFCEYTAHGHCGVLHQGQVDNDATLANLGRQAVVAAQAGADFIAPSAAMDGQVQAIRSALDAAGFTQTAIMAYSTKFASALYGPFREAGGSALKGDRKSYQMNPMNRREAVRESLLDEQEGADALMVKPAGAYLDIIRDIREASRLPLGAYQVSGEYAMIKFGAQAGAIDEARVVRESLGAIKRAGADLIFTYFAMDLALSGI
jgi:porphobilinogen synthase